MKYIIILLMLIVSGCTYNPFYSSSKMIIKDENNHPSQTAEVKQQNCQRNFIIINEILKDLDKDDFMEKCLKRSYVDTIDTLPPPGGIVGHP